VITDLLEVGQLAHAGHVKLAIPLAVVLGRQLRRRKTLVRMAAMAFDVAGLGQRIRQERRDIGGLRPEPLGFRPRRFDQSGQMSDVVRSCWHGFDVSYENVRHGMQNAKGPWTPSVYTGRVTDAA
jgi:hypothetical protein